MDADLDGRPVPWWQPFTLPAGGTLRLGRLLGAGLRTYLAVRGGIDVEPVLGSRSTDLLARLGPAPVRAGDALPIGRSAAGLSAGRNDESAAFDADAGCTILPGPQRDWFSDEAWNLLANAAWTVTPDSNRVAARLSGPALHRSVAAELPSQGLVRGAVQVPPSGELVAFLADHPVTGGYPVIAVLTEAAADRLAQCRPGAVVRFRDAAAPRGPADRPQPTAAGDLQVVDHAIRAETPLLETGLGPERRPRRPAAVRREGVLQARAVGHHPQHLLGVVLPVGGQKPRPARLQA
jgi:biotin-dependent carboxylase-like uncharacterized protein